MVGKWRREAFRKLDSYAARWVGASTASTAPPTSAAYAASLSMRDGTALHQPHDHLFVVFADPKETAAFLRARLPDSHQRGIVWSSCVAPQAPSVDQEPALRGQPSTSRPTATSPAARSRPRHANLRAVGLRRLDRNRGLRVR